MCICACACVRACVSFITHFIVQCFDNVHILFTGGVIFCIAEPWDYLQSFYFCFISLSTIGFGDIVPMNEYFMIIALVYIFMGLALTSMVINVAMEFFSGKVVVATERLKEKLKLNAADQTPHSSLSDDLSPNDVNEGDTAINIPEERVTPLSIRHGIKEEDGELSGRESPEGSVAITLEEPAAKGAADGITLAVDIETPVVNGSASSRPNENENSLIVTSDAVVPERDDAVPAVASVVSESMKDVNIITCAKLVPRFIDSGAYQDEDSSNLKNVTSPIGKILFKPFTPTLGPREHIFSAPVKSEKQQSPAMSIESGKQDSPDLSSKREKQQSPESSTKKSKDQSPAPSIKSDTRLSPARSTGQETAAPTSITGNSKEAENVAVPSAYDTQIESAENVPPVHLPFGETDTPQLERVTVDKPVEHQTSEPVQDMPTKVSDKQMPRAPEQPVLSMRTTEDNKGLSTLLDKNDGKLVPPQETSKTEAQKTPVLKGDKPDSPSLKRGSSDLPLTTTTPAVSAEDMAILPTAKSDSPVAVLQPVKKDTTMSPTAKSGGPTPPEPALKSDKPKKPSLLIVQEPDDSVTFTLPRPIKKPVTKCVTPTTSDNVAPSAKDGKAPIIKPLASKTGEKQQRDKEHEDPESTSGSPNIHKAYPYLKQTLPVKKKSETSLDDDDDSDDAVTWTFQPKFTESNKPAIKHQPTTTKNSSRSPSSSPKTSIPTFKAFKPTLGPREHVFANKPISRESTPPSDSKTYFPKSTSTRGKESPSNMSSVTPKATEQQLTIENETKTESNKRASPSSTTTSQNAQIIGKSVKGAANV